METTQQSRLGAFIEWFIPPSIPFKTEEYETAKILAATSILAMIVPIVIMTNNALQFGWLPKTMSANIALSVTAVISLFCLRTLGLFRFAAWFLMIAMLSNFAALAFFSSGINTSIVGMFGIPSLAMLLILGKRAGWIMTFLSTMVLIGFMMLSKNGFVFVPEYQPQFENNFQFSRILPNALIITILGVLFLNGKHRMLTLLEKEKAIVERKVEEARASREELVREQERSALRDAAILKQTQEQQAYLEESARHILNAMQRFAAGDLTVRVESSGREDDIAKIFTGFNQTVTSVGKLVQQVVYNVEQTSTIAAHISSSTTQMAATSEEQSVQVIQIAATMEEVARVTTEQADQVAAIDTISKQNGTSATEGATVVASAVTKMEQIAMIVEDATSVVQKLGDSSAEIGEIVQVIEEIADQTNLLALNAAIEAARAGEQGRGFAVVADEVRKLAERTAQATKQISGTIKQIQNDTNKAVQRMQNGNTEVQEGLSLAKQAGSALGGIVEGSRNVAQMVGTTVAAMEQQSSSAEEVAKSIDHISASVQETTASLGEIARSTEHLRGLTEDLQELVSQFDVGEMRRNVGLNGGNTRKRLQ